MPSEAVLLCLSVNPDVALLDLSMLGMDGFDGAKRIRNNERRHRQARAPRRVDRARRRAIPRTGQAGGGFDEFLTKPMTLDALEEALAR